MPREKRPAVSFPSTAPVAPKRSEFGKKISKALEAGARRRAKSRVFWGKPKPVKVSDLRAGDIAVSRFQEKLGESLASAVTGYPQMHVSLYLGNGKFFDFSQRAKVLLAETLFSYYPDPFILRPQLSKKQAEKIVSLANGMAGKKVRRGKRIRMVIGLQRTIGIKAKNPGDEGYLCSNSIAEFFKEAGADLVPGVHPLRVSSVDLMKSKKLELING